MAEPITMQKLIDAGIDSDSLEIAVNGDENTNVDTRLGGTYPTLAKAIKTILEQGTLDATLFKTKALMGSSALLNDSYALVTDDNVVENNGYYQKQSGTWVFSGYNPIAQSKAYVDSNALFKPQSLTIASDLNTLKKEGIYSAVTDAVAATLNLPSGLRGQVYVSGLTSVGDYVYQTYINSNGDSFQRYFTSSWSDWTGYTHQQMVSGTNLNDLSQRGVYHAYTSAFATAALNYPFVGTGTLIIVDDSTAGVVRQQALSGNGVAHRYATSSGGVLAWQPWRGVEYSTANGITKLDSFLIEGKIAYKLVMSIVDIGGNVDNATTEGSFFINSGTVASTANGFPITGSGGYLTVKRSASAIHQLWQNHNGYAYRWGGVSGGVVAAWQPWRGATNTQNRIVDLNASGTGTIDRTKLVVYGSSTMWYLTDELESLAQRKNIDLLTYAQSGETVAGAGLGAGTNKVTMTVTGGELIKDTYVPVVVTSTFGNYMRKLITLELSNGVKGIFNPITSAFYAQNITGTMSVPSTEVFDTKSQWLKPDNGVYVIDIGKNDVSPTKNNAQFIIDRTVDIVNDLPKDSQFIVGGHYSNTDSTDMHRTVVEAVNLALKNKYGLKYFDIASILFDDATWVKLGLPKTSADNTAISQRRLPPSLSRDNAHLSPAMDIELALVIENKLTSLGYIT